VRLPWWRNSVAAPDAPTPGAPGSLSDGSPRQRDEVRHLLGLDAIAFAHLLGPDPRHLAPARTG
jgi:hypothetical protein